MRQFFAPPRPDPCTGRVNNTRTNESGAQLNIDEGPNDDVSIGSDEEIVDGIQHQLEAHIAGLKSVEDSDGGQVDNSTNFTVNDGSDSISDDEQFDDNIPSSETFQQLVTSNRPVADFKLTIYLL